MELVHIMLNRRRRQHYKHRVNHFTKWNDTEFHAKFRLSKPVVRFVIDRIADEILPAGDR